jgi:tetratricopeptide (TPR) repeat protein
VHQLILGGTRDRRRQAARAAEVNAPTLTLDAQTLPFILPALSQRPAAGPRVLRIDDLERAFPDAQAGGTRLVLTQSTYLVQKWVDLLEEGDRIVATADRAALERGAPEALRGRGPWGGFEIVDLDKSSTTEVTATDGGHGLVLEEEAVPTVITEGSSVSSVVAPLLARAFATTDSSKRVRLCRDAVASVPQSPVAWLALGSACREMRDGAAAREALDRATALTPDWEAVAYESGKLWLVCDDMPQARNAFQRAADGMPTFSAAFSNLGATLGELDEPAAALNAFRQALAHDPRSFTILNNIGVVCRELGRLDESEAAFRRVIEIHPEFVFGHYNLGHTLFLAGKYRDALGAYEEGQRRDPEQNPRQGCRLAVMRFANGDAAGAERDLWRFANAAPPGEREDLLLEAYEIAHALLTQQPALAPHRPFLDRVGAEIAKSE